MKSKLIVIATAVILIATVILLFYLHSSSEKEVVQRFQAEQLLDSRRLAREIELYLHDRAQEVNSLSSFPSLQNHEMKKMTADIKMVFNFEKNNHVKAVSVYNEKGTILYSTTKDAIGRNYQRLDFFQWAAKKENKGKQFASSLIRKTDDTTTLLPYFRFLLVVPIYRNSVASGEQAPGAYTSERADKFAGIVTSTIDLEEVVSQFLPFVNAYAHKEHAIIMDSNGTVLFHSEHPEMVLRNIRFQDNTCFKCHFSFDHVRTILSRKEGTTEYALKEMPRKLASFSTIEFMNISWKIVICIPSEEVSGFSARNLFMTLILIGIITVTLIGGSSIIYRSNRLKIRAQEEAKQWMEKHKLEESIAESEKKYRDMVENALVGVYRTNLRGEILFVNEAMVKMFEYNSREDLMQSSAMSRYKNPDDRKRLFETLENEGSVNNFEIVLLTKNDIAKTVLLSAKLDGDVLSGMVRDITERTRAEEALRLDSEIMTNIADGVYLVRTSDGVIVHANNQFEKMFGYNSGELIGKHVTIVNAPSDKSPEAMAKEIMDDLNRSGVWNGEVQNVKKDGTTFWCYASVTTFAHSNFGTVWVSVHRDITENKRADKALRESEERFRSLFENSPISLWHEDFSEVKKHIDHLRISGVKNFRTYFQKHPEEVAKFAAKVRVDEVNQSTLQLYQAGNKAELWAGLGLVFGKESYEVFAEELIALAEGKMVFESEAITHTLTGNKNHIILKWLVAPGCEETLSKVFVSIIDITERKRAEKEIMMLANAMKSINEGVSITALENNILFVNKSFVNTYGYTEDELIGQHINIIRSPNNSPEIIGEIQPSTLRGGWQGELWNRKKDGREFPIFLSTTIVHDKDGKLIALIGVATDITERKRAEKEISMLANALRSISECVSITDMENTILFANQSFLNTFGYSEDELIGQNISIVRSPKTSIDTFQDILQSTLRSGWNGEIWNQRKNGSEFPISLSTSVVRDDKGEPLAMIGVATDITERKRAEEELLRAKERAEQSDKLKDAFIANISHEIRTPLNIILGYAGNIEETFASQASEEERILFSSVQSGAERLMRTVDLILNVSRVQAGDIKLNMETIHVPMFIEKLIKDLIPLAQKKLLDLSFKNDCGPIVVKADAYCVSQALINLIDNAIKYTEKGSITVRLYHGNPSRRSESSTIREKNSDVCLDITDTGIGISKKYLGDVFKPYSQEEVGYSRGYEGIGLGLTLAKQYLSLHDVPVTVTSKKGVGTTFSICLTNIVLPNYLPESTENISNDELQSRPSTVGDD